MDTHPSSIRFGVFELDLRTGELRKKGAKVKLDGQPIQILTLLLERPGELLTHEEIRARLWPDGTVVEFESSIKTALRKLRQALGDDAEAPRYIENLPRRGYRFIAPVDGVVAVAARLPTAPGQVAPPKVADGAEPSAARTRAPQGVPLPWPSRARRVLPLTTAVLVFLACIMAWFVWNRYSGKPEPRLRQLTTNSPENPITAAAISPDGKYLAYADQTGIYLRLVETGEMHSLPAPHAGTISALSWFPDGTRLLASGGAEERGVPSTWAISILGGTPRKLRDDVGAASPSPDGSQIAFTSPAALGGNGREIWLMDADGGEPRKIVPSARRDQIAGVLWFPDGRHLLYARVHLEENQPYVSIESLDFKHSQSSVILSDSRLTGGCLLPDGRIVYSLVEPPPNDHEANLWEIGASLRTGQAVGKPRRVTSWDGFYLSGLFSVTADGRRLAFLQRTAQADVFVGELGNDPGQLKAPRRLTLDDRNDLLSAWTADSKAVLFSSDRNGRFDIFRQALDQNSAEVVVAGPENKYWAQMTPDGHWILYVSSPGGWRPSNPLSPYKAEPLSLMRAPVAGGPSESVAQGHPGWFGCARPPANRCVQSDTDNMQLVFSVLDPVHGKGRELARVDYNQSSVSGLNVSPDGSQVAILWSDERQGRIQIISLDGGPQKEVAVNWGRGILSDITWSADGRGWYVGSQSGRVEDLLFIDSRGHAEVLRHQAAPFNMGAVPSPDGRHLAFLEWTSTNNVWMLENF